MSNLEGLALTRPRIDAKMTAEDFMMSFEETIWRFCVLIVDMKGLKLGVRAKTGELARNWRRSSEFETVEMIEEILMILIKENDQTCQSLLYFF